MSVDVFRLPVDAIDIPEGRRPLNNEAVATLSDSIASLGLLQPITVVRSVDGEGVQSHALVAGRHRLAAVQKLGWTHIDCIVKHASRFGAVEAEMAEIAENLHRAELSALQRSEQINRWRELAKVRTLSAPSGQQPRESGNREAARELSISEKAVRNAKRVAGLADEAKAVAREVGLEDNRSALVEASKEPTPEAQVHYLRTRAEKPQRPASDPLNDIEAEERQVAALMVAWNKAGQKARETFLSRIETPVMGRQWA